MHRLPIGKSTVISAVLPVFPGCNSKLFDIHRLPELNQLRTAMRCYRLRHVPRPDCTRRGVAEFDRLEKQKVRKS